jgi:hypothetical protein
MSSLITSEHIVMINDEVLIGDNEEVCQLYKCYNLYLTISEKGVIQYWKPTWTGTELEQMYVRHYTGLPYDEELIDSDYFIAGYAEPVKVLPAHLMNSLSE